jgi:hypothetical protein
MIQEFEINKLKMVSFLLFCLSFALSLTIFLLFFCLILLFFFSRQDCIVVNCLETIHQKEIETLLSVVYKNVLNEFTNI